MNKMKKLITAIMVPTLVLFSGSILAKSDQGEKVLLCHNGHEINVSVHAQQQHLDNHEDDNEGECSDGPTVEVCHVGVSSTFFDTVLESDFDDYQAFHEDHGDMVKSVESCA